MNKKYFWDEFKEPQKELIKEELLGGGYRDLQYIYGGWLTSGLAGTIQDSRSVKTHELFLAWLLPLLKSGQLKMRREKIQAETDPEKIRLFRENAIFKGLIPGKEWKVMGYEETTSEKIEADIEKLKADWNACPNDDVNMFEMSIHFILPENKWPD